MAGVTRRWFTVKAEATTCDDEPVRGSVHRDGAANRFAPNQQLFPFD